MLVLQCFLARLLNDHEALHHIGPPSVHAAKFADRNSHVLRAPHVIDIESFIRIVKIHMPAIVPGHDHPVRHPYLVQSIGRYQDYRYGLAIERLGDVLELERPIFDNDSERVRLGLQLIVNQLNDFLLVAPACR